MLAYSKYNHEMKECTDLKCYCKEHVPELEVIFVYFISNLTNPIHLYSNSKFDKILFRKIKSRI